MIDSKRDELLTDCAKAMLKDRYLSKGETPQDLFARVAKYYSTDSEHAERLYNYMSLQWFMPATPILSNGGTKRGLPISCFLNEVEDSLKGIGNTHFENIHLASGGGGIGTYWGGVRGNGEKIREEMTSSGIIPFLKVQDSSTLAISQGNLRRGSAATYIAVSHPEIEEFIEIRRPTGGDPNRKCMNLHHGIAIDDKFMKAVANGDNYDLISPSTGKAVETVKARDIWIKILTARIETGEPYLLFIDNVNNNLPKNHKELGLKVKTSNLCSEITLPTGYDHKGNFRTAVCCLSSLNLEHYKKWVEDEQFIYDVMLFLDNVLQDFIDNAPAGYENAVYSATQERSVGLGVMGFHSFLQSEMIPFESLIARGWNNKIFSYIKEKVDQASIDIAKLRGACPDDESGTNRFTNKTAIAPTASISIICGGASPGIEPIAGNSYVQKNLSGSFAIRNKFLEALLKEKGKNTEEVWSSISTTNGSVQHLEFLSNDEKNVFKTAYELNQRYLVDFACDRQKYIDQAQSLNIFLPSDVHKKDLHGLHFMGWKNGLKSFYYCRSQSLQRADIVSVKQEEINNYEECLSCQ